MMTPVQNLNSHQWNAPIITPTRPPAPFVPQERTPLIRKANSFHSPTTKGYDSIEGKRKPKIRSTLPRKALPLEPIQKTQATVPVKPAYVGRSTFGQTVSVKRVSYQILPTQRFQIQAVQLDRHTPRYRNNVATSRLCLCRMGLRYPLTHVLWAVDVLHVGIIYLWLRCVRLIERI